MSFADACLVRMSELIKASFILTLDSDFLIYRKNRNQIIKVIIPDELNLKSYLFDSKGLTEDILAELLADES
jgi:predicted nucleic acid-binding protein